MRSINSHHGCVTNLTQSGNAVSSHLTVQMIQVGLEHFPTLFEIFPLYPNERGFLRYVITFTIFFGDHLQQHRFSIIGLKFTQRTCRQLTNGDRIVLQQCNDCGSSSGASLSNNNRMAFFQLYISIFSFQHVNQRCLNLFTQVQ